MTVELYPAVDVRGGRCVRLVQGDFDAETVYDGDPVAVARSHAAAGAPWVHVVDLDAARTGEPTNTGVIEAVAAAAGARVQVGGGVRTVEHARRLAEAGVSRVVIGTAAVADPGFVARVASSQPVAVGLDVRGREVAVRGWREGTGLDLTEALGRIADAGAEAVIVTQIAVDGTMAGPDLDLYRELLGESPVPVIASGGVGDLADLRALASLEVDGRRLAGVIVGRALYEGRFGVPEALRALSGGPVG